MNTTHLYSVSVSNVSRLDTILAHMPTKYFDCLVEADKIAQRIDAAAVPVGRNAGSVEAYFVMTADLANALRKWFKRRFKGRSKFARRIVPTQFAVSRVASESDAIAALLARLRRDRDVTADMLERYAEWI